jgi:hypothetical protein
MNKIKLLLVFILLAGIATVFAQNTVSFKDASNPNVTKLLVLAEDPAYPMGSGALTYANRFLIQMYKSPDNVIDPLGSNGLPTNGDIQSTIASPSLGNMYCAFNIAGTYLNISNFVLANNGGAGNTWGGDKVYLRIFNKPTIAAATKYIQFNALYTVASGTQSPSIVAAPINGWTAWIDKPVTPLVSGLITSVLPVSGVTVLCTGQSEYTTNATGSFNFSVPNGANITITPSKLGYTFSPVSLSYTNVQAAITGVDFVMTKSAPNLANTPTPPSTDPYTIVPVTQGQLQWQYTPEPGYALPTHFRIALDVAGSTYTVPDVQYTGASAYSSPIPVLPYGAYCIWIVTPYNGNTKGQAAAGNVNFSLDGLSNGKADAVNAPSWVFRTEPMHETAPGVDEIVDLTGGTYEDVTFVAPDLPTTPNITYTIIPVTDNFPGFGFVENAFAVNVNVTGTSTTLTELEITVPLTGTWYVMSYYDPGTGLDWIEAQTAMPTPVDHFPVSDSDTGIDRTVYFYNIPFLGKDGDIEILFTEGLGENPTLPVELSSFTAVLTSQYFINLTWVTESETQVSGFYIYRSEDNNFGNALCLNPANIVPATNTSQQQSYTMTDTEELLANQTYYYWLDSVDLGGSSSLHGPISATVTGQPIPELPEISMMSNAYPNPFRMGTSTSINVTIKAGEKGTVKIYNVRGQLVETFKVKAGVNKLTWNAKGCGSGIYLQKLSTPSVNNTKKLVIIN